MGASTAANQPALRARPASCPRPRPCAMPRAPTCNVLENVTPSKPPIWRRGRGRGEAEWTGTGRRPRGSEGARLHHQQCTQRNGTRTAPQRNATDLEEEPFRRPVEQEPPHHRLAVAGACGTARCAGEKPVNCGRDHCLCCRIPVGQAPRAARRARVRSGCRPPPRTASGCFATASVCPSANKWSREPLRGVKPCRRARGGPRPPERRAPRAWPPPGRRRLRRPTEPAPLPLRRRCGFRRTRPLYAKRLRSRIHCHAWWVRSKAAGGAGEMATASSPCLALQ